MFTNFGNGWFPYPPPKGGKPDRGDTKPRVRKKSYPTEPLEPSLDLIPDTVPAVVRSEGQAPQVENQGTDNPAPLSIPDEASLNDPQAYADKPNKKY